MAEGFIEAFFFFSYIEHVKNSVLSVDFRVNTFLIVLETSCSTFSLRSTELVWLLYHLCEIVWGVFISFIWSWEREHIKMAEGCGLCPHHPFDECANIHKNWRTVIKIILVAQRLGFSPWVEKIPWGKKWQPTPVSLAWGIPWTEEPDRLRWSMGSQEYLASKQEQQLRLSLLPFNSQFFRSLSSF